MSVIGVSVLPAVPGVELVGCSVLARGDTSLFVLGSDGLDDLPGSDAAPFCAAVSAPPPGGPAERQFEGFRLDEAGVPIFLFSVEGARVEERFEASENGLRRTVRWNVEVLRSVALSHPAGVTVTEAPDSQAGKLTFVYTWG